MRPDLDNTHRFCMVGQWNRQRKTNVSTTSTSTMPKESKPIRARSPRTWSSSLTGSSTSWERLRRVGHAVLAPAGVSWDCVEPSRPLCESAGVLEDSAADSTGAEDSKPLLDASCPAWPVWGWAALAARRSPPVLRFRAGLRRWLFDLRLFRAMLIRVLSCIQ